MVTDTKIPKGYRQTDVDIIPEAWEVKDINEIFLITAGGDLNKDAFSVVKDESHPYPIYSNSLVDSGLYGYSSDYKYEKSCITVTARGTIGVAVARAQKFNAIGRVLVLNPITELNCGFISEYINNRVNFSIESTGVPQLTAPQSSKYKVAFPKPSEQNAIATVLSDVDNLINSLEKLIAKKRDIKQGAMQELLTGKRRMPGFSGEWEVKKIGEMLGYERPDKYIVESTDYVASGDVPVLTANKSFVLGYTNETKGIYKDIPVIIFDDFTTDSKYVYFPFKVKSSAIKILKKKDSDIDLKFIFERMQLIKFPMGGHKRYYISEYQRTDLKVPKFEEQTAIAKVLSDMDDEIERLERKRDKYNAIKQGMLQVLLTGRIRLV